MENLKKKLKIVQETIDVSNQSPIKVGGMVDKLQSSSSLDDSKSNAVNEYHHHESLDVEKLESSSSLELQLNNSSENDLNEDCLLEIFSYLSINDMIQVKRVCKKWYKASEQWFKQVQTLVYHEDCSFNIQGPYGRLEFHEKYYKRKIYDECSICGFNDVISILQSYGHHIKYYQVRFSIPGRSLTEKCKKFLFQWVPKLCKNIVDIGIHGRPALYEIFKMNPHSYDTYIPSYYEMMATHWKKLEKIHIIYFPSSADQNFFQLLHNNKQLKTIRLDIELYGNFDDKFFTYLPTTIEEIIIKQLSINPITERSDFISLSKNYTSLQSLALSGFELTDAMVAAIADIKSLIHLSLADVPNLEFFRTIDKIANLKGLKSLNFSYTINLQEDSFIYIVESCIQLEQLGIYNDKWLTDKGMATIAELKQLKCLTLNARRVTRSIINSCENLEYLRFICLNINDNDAIKLLKKATNLRFVDFGYGRNLTEDFLRAANKIANERKNNFLCIKLCKNIYFIHEDIDTPYSKYGLDQKIPLEIFPKNMRNNLKLLYLM